MLRDIRMRVALFLSVLCTKQHLNTHMQIHRTSTTRTEMADTYEHAHTASLNEY